MAKNANIIIGGLVAGIVVVLLFAASQFASLSSTQNDLDSANTAGTRAVATAFAIRTQRADDINALEATADQVASDTDATSTQVADIITGLNTAGTQSADDIASLDAAATQSADDIAALNQAATDTMNAQATAITEQESTSIALSSNVDDLTTAVAEQSEQISDMSATSDAVSGQLADAQATVTAQANQLSDAIATITALEAVTPEPDTSEDDEDNTGEDGDTTFPFGSSSRDDDDDDDESDGDASAGIEELVRYEGEDFTILLPDNYQFFDLRVDAEAAEDALNNAGGLLGSLTGGDATAVAVPDTDNSFELTTVWVYFTQEIAGFPGVAFFMDQAEPIFETQGLNVVQTETLTVDDEDIGFIEVEQESFNGNIPILLYIFFRDDALHLLAYGYQTIDDDIRDRAEISALSFEQVD